MPQRHLTFPNLAGTRMSIRAARCRLQVKRESAMRGFKTCGTSAPGPCRLLQCGNAATALHQMDRTLKNQWDFQAWLRASGMASGLLKGSVEDSGCIINNQLNGERQC
jgi:hypothetical protein